MTAWLQVETFGPLCRQRCPEWRHLEKEKKKKFPFLHPVCSGSGLGRSSNTADCNSRIHGCNLSRGSLLRFSKSPVSRWHKSTQHPASLGHPCPPRVARGGQPVSLGVQKRVLFGGAVSGFLKLSSSNTPLRITQPSRARAWSQVEPDTGGGWLPGILHRLQRWGVGGRVGTSSAPFWGSSFLGGGSEEPRFLR